MPFPKHLGGSLGGSHRVASVWPMSGEPGILWAGIFCRKKIPLEPIAVGMYKNLL